MFNPIDMLQGQSAGMQGLAQQFGLTTDQTRRAMEALLPAFTIGLQRNASSDPTGFGQLFGFPLQGAKPPATQAPELMLGQLFGSPMLAQAVVQQASAASGVGSQVVRQMLPLMAGMVVASIVHMMLNQTPPAPQPAAKPEAEGSNPYLMANSFWGDMLRAFAPPQNPQAAPVAPQPPSPPPVEKASPEAQPLDMFNKMLQTGAEVQEQNVKAMQDIFDAFWSDPKGGAKEEAGQPPIPAAKPPSRAPRSGSGGSAGRTSPSRPAAAKEATKTARKPGKPTPR
ncbi:hypothetical protein J2X36_003464 [Methylobacterium sp. BE186]|uniref:DUF937 domain-containing protein n=1 Tax=Methylobacterium sp. BE186 TaxID=2817715 RepID=UPI002864C0AC|nr:DUF937 domain-containing protein [Methylobacterium sp. BE186]MDR7038694.1 hypothetical protein [Methylobacterium sp. BE186]